jgi:gliding motility-associated-like protein
MIIDLDEQKFGTCERLSWQVIGKNATVPMGRILLLAVLLTLAHSFTVYGQILDLCPPVAGDDSNSTNENTPVMINVVANDADCLTDALLGGKVNPATVDLNTAVAGIQNSINTAQGSFSANSAGMVTFTPSLNYSGTASEGYTVNDNSGKTSNVATITITVIAGNNPPVANAGGNKTITLPANSVVLNGSGTDSDGSIAGYSWTKVSGGAATLTNANTASLTASGLMAGTYVFRLTVTDNQGAQASDDATVTVNPAANVSPVANAGGNKAITLPANSVVLNGSGTDSDGNIAGYLWIKVSGGTATLTNANTASLTASGLAAGTYVFRLTVTDNQGAQASDDATVTVNPAANVTPVANAGGNKTITLPANSVILNGSGTDSDGSIASYLWTKVSGGAATLTNANMASLTASALVAGTYVFRLTVTDNQGAQASDDATVTVNPAANVTPVANAGGNKTITLPANSVVLNGSGTDSDGNIAGYLWTKVSGGTATLTNANTASLTVSGLVAGTYVFRLTVTDNQGAQASDDATVIVNPAGNVAPFANAGGNKSVTLPANSVVLNGSGTDSDGSIAGYSWTKVSGGAATLTNANATSLTASGLVAGTYVFRLTVTDNQGAQASDDATVIVNPAGNVAPVANAGGNKTITLPANSVVLNGSGTDSDGTIASYSWTKVSGGTTTLTNANTASLTASGLVAGTYVFRLTVTDNQGAQASDDATVTVNLAANVAPVANAGGNKSITLPANSVVLNGSGTDSDGTIAGYSWAKVSGGTATLTNANMASLTVSGLVAGTYVFRLTVTDNQGAQASDDATVTVNPVGSNASPVANAGPDKTITLPTNSVVLSGSGTDSDGSITTYAWTQVSGPSVTMTNTSQPAVSLSNLVAGIYTFRLTVTDNQGATGSDDAVVVVNSASTTHPLVANNDNASTGKNTPVTINVVANDTDSGGTINPGTVDLNTSLSGIQNTNSTAQGSFTVDNSGVVTFTPATDFAGVATLSYTVNNDTGATSDAAIITINVIEANGNQAPVAKNDSIHTHKNTPVTIDVVANDSDSDGTVDKATVDLDTSLNGIQNKNSTPQGNFTVTSSGVVTFVPALNYVGLAAISYTVRDNDSTISNAATIAITVDETAAALDIPTAFTPNGDGANETWKIVPRQGTDLNQFQNAEVRIYNKHGMLMYEANGFENRWDGRQNGEVLPADTYYYTIDLKIDNIRYKGVVTLLR